jgi:anti-anti-sigma factor
MPLGGDRGRPPAFDLNVLLDDDVAIVAVTGEIDMATASELRGGLIECVERTRAVLVDLCRCSFMDGAGAQAIVAAAKRADARGVAMGIACAPGTVPRVLFDTMLPGVYELHESRQAGLTALREQAA